MTAPARSDTRRREIADPNPDCLHVLLERLDETNAWRCQDCNAAFSMGHR